jgi:hypothetical protein
MILSMAISVAVKMPDLPQKLQVHHLPREAAQVFDFQCREVSIQAMLLWLFVFSSSITLFGWASGGILHGGPSLWTFYKVTFSGAIRICRLVWP